MAFHKNDLYVNQVDKNNGIKHSDRNNPQKNWLWRQLITFEMRVEVMEGTDNAEGDLNKDVLGQDPPVVEGQGVELVQAWNMRKIVKDDLGARVLKTAFCLLLW